MKKLSIIAALIIAVLAMSYYLFQPKSSLSETKLRPIAVQIALVKQEPVAETIQTVGTVYAKQAVQLSAQIDGQIENILFTEGAAVKQGTPLIELNNAIYQANLESAEADLQLSKVNYQRQEKLAKQRAVAKEQLDQSLATLKEKRAQVAVDKAILAKTIIVAPFSGLLGAKQINVGQYVKRGTPLVQLVDTEHLKVSYSVPEKYLPKLELGQKVEINTHGEPEINIEGNVIFISPIVDLSTRSVQVQVEVDNPNNQLRPGQFVRIKQTLDINPNALVIPEQALMPSLSGQQVFTTINNKAHAVSVSIGTRFANKVQILSGLKSGEKVIIAGQQKLKEGSLVKEVAGP